MKKIITPEEAVAHIKSGMTLMIGGFLGNGSPHKIIEKMLQSDVRELTLISNDAAFPDKGHGRMIADRRVKKLIISHAGTNPMVTELLNAGTLEVVFVPQGTIAECIRAAGAGLGGVLTPTGLGTIVEQGKQKIAVDGKEYLLEKPLRADIALLGASVGDSAGNLIYRGTSQNMNPLMATAADLVIAEVGELMEVGSIVPEQVHTLGIFVDYIVKSE